MLIIYTNDGMIVIPSLPTMKPEDKPEAEIP